MDRNNYVTVGFKSVGTIKKDRTLKKKKYHVYKSFGDFISEKKVGVYLICEGNEIHKIGQTKNLKYRFQCYESHTGVTNNFVRDKMKENTDYEILFLECQFSEVMFGGVNVKTGIIYDLLEKTYLHSIWKQKGDYRIGTKV